MPAWTPMPPTIVTDRLTLGPWSREDLDEFEALVRERATRTPGTEMLDRSELAGRLERRLTELDDTGIALLALRIDGRFAGYCGLTPGRASIDEPELAYELPVRFHGHGFATEAAGAVVATATDTGRQRLWASVRTWNTASFRVLEKVGFERTGAHVDSGDVDARGENLWCRRELVTPSGTSEPPPAAPAPPTPPV